jgi:hypothetical protein
MLRFILLMLVFVIETDAKSKFSDIVGDSLLTWKNETNVCFR